MARIIGIAAALALCLAGGLWLLFGQTPRSHDMAVIDASAQTIDGLPGSVAVFATIVNAGGPDRLLSVHAKDAEQIRIVGPHDVLAIPAISESALAADGAYVELRNVTGGLGPGRLIPLTFEFEQAGEVNVVARMREQLVEGAAHHEGLLGFSGICRVGEGEPAPSIQLALASTNEGGFVVDVVTDEFEFSQDMVDGPHVPGMGHGHLYLNGLKLGRLYAPQAEIGALPAGTHEVRVTINTNDHRAYVVDDRPVTAFTTIEID